jgi:hypothetical protein
MIGTRRKTPLAVGIALCFGCATKSLPPGTPPPEYETRSIEPWPPHGTDAGADDVAPPPNAPSAAPSDSAPDVRPGDAGVAPRPEG